LTLKRSGSTINTKIHQGNKWTKTKVTDLIASVKDLSERDPHLFRYLMNEVQTINMQLESNRSSR